MQATTNTAASNVEAASMVLASSFVASASQGATQTFAAAGKLVAYKLVVWHYCNQAWLLRQLSV